MSRLILPLIVYALCTTVAFSIPQFKVPDGSKIKDVETHSCRWVCGKYGEFIECAPDEVVMGTCGSQSWANCENQDYCPGQRNIYAAIKCCKVETTLE